MAAEGRMFAPSFAPEDSVLVDRVAIAFGVGNGADWTCPAFTDGWFLGLMVADVVGLFRAERGGGIGPLVRMTGLPASERGWTSEARQLAGRQAREPAPRSRRIRGWPGYGHEAYRAGSGTW